MVKIIDGLFGAALLLGAALHAFGSVLSYQRGTELLVWALAGSLAAALVAAMNLLRVCRPADTAIAVLALASAAAWCIVALAFGNAIGAYTDLRVVWHVAVSLGLAGFSAWALLQ